MARLTTSRPSTRARIVDVASQLLAEHGPSAMTTRGVAEAAGVQAPAIYRLFGDKDGLMDAVAEHVMATYVTTKAEVVRAAEAAEVDPVEDLRAGWRTQMDFGLANPTLFRLLSDPDRGQHSPAAQAGLQVLRTRVHRVAQAGRLRVSEQRAVGLVHAAGAGAIQTLLAAPVDERDPGLADSLLEAVLRQVLTDAGEPVEDAPSAAAVALRAHTAGLQMLSDAERRLLTEWLDRVVEGSAQARQRGQLEHPHGPPAELDHAVLGPAADEAPRAGAGTDRRVPVRRGRDAQRAALGDRSAQQSDQWA